MKANEVNSQAVMFVKKFGLEAAYDLWQGSFPLYENNMCILNGSVCTLNSEFMFNLLDIKSLIESHELVGNFGGIKRAKRIIKKSYKSFNTMVSVVWNDNPYQCTIEKLEQAILDVESCQ